MMIASVWMVSVLPIAGSATAQPAHVAADTGARTGILQRESEPAVFDHAALDCHFDLAGPTDAVSPGMLQERSEPEDLPEAAPDFGTPGSMRLNVHGGFGIGVTASENTLAIAGAGISYFAAEDISIDLELNGLGAFQNGEDAAGINLNLLVRYHFLSGENWSLYVDGGAGLLLTSDDVPENGSSFNFTPQAGFGVTYDIGSDNRLFAGIRWHHISNANTFEENPGRDSVFVYAGVSMPF